MAQAPDALHLVGSLSSSSQRSLLQNGKEVSSDLGKTLEDEARQQQQQEASERWRISNLAFFQRLTLGYSSLASQAQPVLSPTKTFRRIAIARELVSINTPDVEEPASSSHGIRLREGVNLPGVGEIRWKIMKNYAMEWLKNPKNLALLVWILAVAVSGAILFMVMTGMLNHAIPKKSSRDAYFEVNNQILNALFTLMCLYLHPQRFLHLYQLHRWNRSDVLALRKIYCKDGLRKPHEWGHMLVVVILLHLNCFSQYALCGLNWGYRRSERPAIGVAVCLAAAIGCAAAAGIYNTLSPLGRDYVQDEEAGQLHLHEDLEADARPSSIGRTGGRFYSLLERRKSFASRDGKLVERPEWQGGVLDCCMDREVALMSTLCGFCVFGWNMDRLGFGNRFVHIATFLLICSAPYWIFLLAAGNIDNRYVRQGLGFAGIVLCVFGLMYGGFWRIKMRTTFGLPGQRWCCGQPNMTDCALWMFCSLCSLCQEVRTAARYDVRDDKFYVKEPTRNREGSSFSSSSPSPSSSPKPSPLGREQASKAPFDTELKVEMEMVAPSPVVADRNEILEKSS
ncbi:uncharacterized protein LOC9654637 [Selaginella moellendorffii]|nr:uncharacterized protein LOC9654637 [Selaginella moellendorffii]|eukprot:XP_002983180.2 uncharacterized protein LOC9654637 [Selaginella moellendorffii]